eukprot:15323046-Ditylum_brightwellii.AAC.1
MNSFNDIIDDHDEDPIRLLSLDVSKCIKQLETAGPSALPLIGEISQLFSDVKERSEKCLLIKRNIEEAESDTHFVREQVRAAEHTKSEAVASREILQNDINKCVEQTREIEASELKKRQM